ncbi:MAG TPA: DUF6588 family protein [Bacteroidota bacterium]|nr:DUF6588 family protein [Bacteroidota bacterium]
MPTNAVARRIISALVVLFGMMMMMTTAHAQNPVEDAIQQLNSSTVKGYLQPFIDGVGADLNSGVYHSADIGTGFSLKLELVAMGTLIGDAQKVYSAVPPVPFDQTPVQTATIFGGRGTTVQGPGVSYQFQNGQLNLSAVPLIVPQLSIGNIMGTQAVIRYIPIPDMNNFPKSTFFGVGLRHSISQYLPNVPVDLAAGAFYQQLTIGSLMEEKTLNFSGEASKSFSILTIYGGVQYESATMTLDYNYQGYGATADNHVHLDLDGQNNFRFTAGLGLDLLILHLSADANFGTVTVISGAVGFGL